MGQLASKPRVDARELVDGRSVFIWLVGKGVVVVLDIQPVHSGAADGFGELKGGHAGKVVDETINQQFHLHAAQLGQIVVLVSHTRLKCGRLGAIFFALIDGQLAVQFSHKLRVLLEQRAVRGAKSVAEFLEIFLQCAEYTLQCGLIAQVAVQLLVHKVRIIGRGHGLVGAGIGHARPWIGPIAYAHAKF